MMEDRPVPDDPDARFTQYRAWASRCAYKYCDRKGVSNHDRDIVKNSALIGLWSACLRWSPTFGIPFHRYAISRVIGEVQDEVRRTSSVKHRGYINRGEAPPTVTSIELFRLSDDRDGTQFDVGALDACFDDIDSKSLLQYVSDLRARRVMEMYFYEEWSMHTIADSLDVSESRVAQIILMAIKELRRKLGVPVDLDSPSLRWLREGHDNGKKETRWTPNVRKRFRSH